MLNWMTGSRRLAVAAIAGAAVLGSAAAAVGSPGPVRDLAFSIVRDDSRIGRHEVRIEEDGPYTRVAIDIEIEVSIGFLPLFEYSHSNRETWKDGRLVALETRTNDNGTAYQVSAQAVAEGLRVEGSSGTFIAPADIIPTSYWNPATVQQTRLLDTQKGRILDVSIRPQEWQSVPGPEGKVNAQRYQMTGDLKLDLWYDPEGVWRRIAFEARGEEVAYLPLSTPPQQADASE